LPCLNSFRGGGPITPINYITTTGCPFFWDFPVLDFKFVNNSKETLFLSEIVFDVEESCPDRRPFFTIREDTQRRQAGTLVLINEGWCNLCDLVISFDLVPGVLAPESAYTSPYTYTVRIPQLVDHAEVVILDAFQREGVDIEGLVYLYDGKWESDMVYVARKSDGSEDRITIEQLSEQLKKCYGPFLQATGTLIGEISFSTIDAPTQHYQVKFQAVVYLENRNLIGVLVPSRIQYDTEFEAQGAKYQRKVAISHEIKPFETERFTVKIAVPQSSYHQLRATVYELGGVFLQSLPIEMTCFVPRRNGGDGILRNPPS